MVVALNELLDVLNEFTYRAKRTTADSATGDQSEPALDLIQPRAVRGREVPVVARAPGEPDAHAGVFRGAVIVEDQMHIERVRDVVTERVEKREKLLMPMPGFALSDHLARSRIEGGKERGRAVAE